MKPAFTFFSLAILFAARALEAQSSPPPVKPGPALPTLSIDSCSAAVSLGKATLIVDPLVHKGRFYVGDYRLDVAPFFFMSETGTLELNAPDATVNKLLAGIAAGFTGKASNNKQGKPKIITGKITPSTNHRGSVTFSVDTDNGPMVFNTFYRFGQ
jgi:hypothetical protein